MSPEPSLLTYIKYETKWASSRENLSLEFPPKRVSNQSPELQRLSRKMEFHMQQVYIYFPKINSKGADQNAQMRRLVCACVVIKPRRSGFLASAPK